jgi:hypothetical protein
MDTEALERAAEAGKHGGGHLSNGPGQTLKAAARKIVALSKPRPNWSPIGRSPVADLT